MSFLIGNILLPQLLATIPWIAVIAAASVAVVIDLRTRRVPNALTGPLILSALIWAAARSLGVLDLPGRVGTAGLGDSLLGALAAGLPFMILWVLRGAGAGDAKLMLAAGAWLGLSGGTLLLLFTAISGGVIALAWAATQRQLLVTLANVPATAAQSICSLRGLGTHAHNVQGAVAADARANPAASATHPAKLNHKLPYAVAIFIGACLAAAWGLYR